MSLTTSIATGGGVIGAIVAQSQESGSPLRWDSILSGALASSPIAAFAFWQMVRSQQEAKAAREETSRVRDAASQEMRDMHREHVELIERVFPVLTEATTAIKDVQRGMAATMDTGGRGRADRELASRLEDVLSALESSAARPPLGHGREAR